MSITYQKSIKMKIECHDGTHQKKNCKLLTLHLENDTSDRLDNSLIITSPKGEKIVVNAYWLKEACEKSIALRNI